MSSSQGSISDMSKYIDKIENKYKRALRFIEENVTVRQELEAAYFDVKQ